MRNSCDKLQYETPSNETEILRCARQCYEQKNIVLVYLDELFDGDFKQRVISYAENKYKRGKK